MQDATLSIDLLCSLKNCNGRIAGTFGIFLPVFQTLTDLTIATGMCLGGHLVGHPLLTRYKINNLELFP